MSAITFTPPPSAMKAAAHAMVANARRKGVIKDLVCCECGAGNAHAHHEDYSKPNEITPLCPPCHRKRHAALGWGIRKPSGKAWRATLTFSLPTELRASLEKIATQNGCSLSELIRNHFSSTLTA